MKLFILSLLIFLNSCLSNHLTPKNEIQSFYAHLYLNWIYANKITEIKNSGIIDKPLGAEILLFQISYPSDKENKTIENCFYYRVPFKKITGKLIVTENKKLENCHESLDGNIVGELTPVDSLEIDFKDGELKLQFNFDHQKKSLKFPLINISNGSVHERNKNEKELKKLSGLRIARLNDFDFNPKFNSFIGSKLDKYSTKTSIQCQKIDKDCNQIGENICDRCKYGSFSVVDYQCLNMTNRFCGFNNCGQKNEPACSRGLKTLDSEIDGICENDLNPVLNSEHILVCQ